MTNYRESIQAALQAFPGNPLRDSSSSLLAILGYRSNRTADWSLDDFIELGKSAAKPLTANNRKQLRALTSLQLIFQVGDAELSSNVDLFHSSATIDAQRIHSYLFFVAELPEGHRTRGELIHLARLINKPLPMPAIVLFRHGGEDEALLSIAILRRRLNKRDTSRDVLEKATLIKDIRCQDPIRAHLEILNDFALDNLREASSITNFVTLHAAWEEKLDSYALSNDFYREIADWYFWARHQVDDGTIRLPQHCDTDEEKSFFLIRLLTRVIFSWFLVEKRLIPTDLFRKHRLKSLIKDFNPSHDYRKPDTAPTYYRAVLQNLFFGTLNMPLEQREFRKKKKPGGRYDANYGITNLWRYEAALHDRADWESLACRIPFLNGGLFDCLDDKRGKKKGNFILDGFSDREDHGCHLPNDLFFGPERMVDLSKDYGEEKKKTARSKKAKVRGLIKILSRYKFTVEENTPLEEEIALDPELLGKVFENLLASYNEDTRTTARKALGAFYTPREIVSYMVDEALKSYLSTQVPRCKGALDDLFSNIATLKEIQLATREALIAAIGRVKILDPACGSGAFPMGALHRLVDLLQKLDPNNESWKRDRLAEARRYRELLEESGAAKEEIATCDDRIVDIEKSFDTRFHALDFGRKLYLIENSIYGVDIQPIATQIAKLRFFISLVVDQNVDPKANNLGVRPLPNLETRLVAADTLIPIEKANNHQFDILDQHVRPLRRELERVRHEHFMARSPAKKRKLREDDERLRDEIGELLENNGLPADSADKLRRWDPYDQNEYARFFDCEWMFGFPVGKVRIDQKASGNLSLINEAGGQGELTPATSREIDSGFDIVIGNPPYIRIQTLKQKDPSIVAFYKEHYASAAKGNYDIYVVFIEAGLRLLKSDGHLAYICPHKFFNAKYGESLRDLVSKERHLRHIVHFGDQQVFLGATIYTCLLFLSKGASETVRFSKPESLDDWLKTYKAAEATIRSGMVSGSPWNFTAGESLKVMEKFTQHPRCLGDVSSRIYQGLVTGSDPVFILQNTSLVGVHASAATEEEHEIEPELMHPLCKGSVDIRRYRIGRLEKAILFPYRLVDGKAELISASQFEAQFPNAWKYLLRNRERLESREGGKWVHEKWYAFGRSQNLSEMEQAKLLTPSIAAAACFTLDKDGAYYFVGSGGGGGGGYGITVRPEAKMTLRVLLGILNSLPADFFLKKISSPFANGYFAYNRQFIEQIPIPTVGPEHEPYVEFVVEILLVLHQFCSEISFSRTTRAPLMLAFWERVLNGLVYELYFPEEVHGADLRLFNLVEKADLPDMKAMPEAERFQLLRHKFEELHDGAHPLRIALDKLQTLDTVRIIEGKA